MTTPPSYNLTSQLSALYTKLNAGVSLARIAVIGDSIAFRSAYPNALHDTMVASFSEGGFGYRAANTDFNWGTTLKAQFLGTLINRKMLPCTGLRDPMWGIYTPDGGGVRLSNDAILKLTIPAGHTIKLHYLTFPGGGSLAVDKSGVRINTIDTDSANGDASVTLSSGTSYALRSLSGDRYVQVNGVEVIKATGVCIDRLGRGNNNPHNYNTGNTDSTKVFLTALSPDLFIIQTDWYSPNQSKSSFITDLKAYIDFLRLSVNGAKIILIAHHAMSSDSQAVSDTLYQIAVSKSCGFIDHLQVKTYAENVAAGYLQADGVHLTDAGGAYFAAYDKSLFAANH